MGRFIQVRFSPRDRAITLSFRTPQVLPEETMRHVRAANRELLLAFRSYLDQFIQRLEAPPPEKRERAKIEVKEEGEA